MATNCYFINVLTICLQLKNRTWTHIERQGPNTLPFDHGNKMILLCETVFRRSYSAHLRSQMISPPQIYSTNCVGYICSMFPRPLPEPSHRCHSHTSGRFGPHFETCLNFGLASENAWICGPSFWLPEWIAKRLSSSYGRHDGE